MKNILKRFRIESLFGEIEFCADLSLYSNLKVTEEDGFVHYCSKEFDNQTCVGYENSGIDYKNPIKGIPLNMTKEDVLKLIDIQHTKEMIRKLNQDTYIKSKDPINITIKK